MEASIDLLTNPISRKTPITSVGLEPTIHAKKYVLCSTLAGDEIVDCRSSGGGTALGVNGLQQQLNNRYSTSRAHAFPTYSLSSPPRSPSALGFPISPPHWFPHHYPLKCPISNPLISPSSLAFPLPYALNPIRVLFCLKRLFLSLFRDFSMLLSPYRLKVLFPYLSPEFPYLF